MGSKATAALLRLREMDKKYKHRQEDKLLIDSDSSSKGTRQEVLRPQLSIKIPDAYGEEYLDTNSSDDNDKEHSIAVKVVSDLLKSSLSQENHEGSILESDKDQINELDDNEIEDNKDLINDETNEDLSISENLEASHQSISEVLVQSENDNESLNVEITVESTASTDTEVEVERINSGNTSIAKYSDDSFESNSSEDDNKLPSKAKSMVSIESELEKAAEPILESPKDTVIVFNRDNISNRHSNAEDKTLIDILQPKDIGQDTDKDESHEDIINDDNISNISESIIITKNKSSPDARTSQSNNYDASDSKETENKFSSKSRSSQDNSASTDVSPETLTEKSSSKPSQSQLELKESSPTANLKETDEERKLQRKKKPTIKSSKLCHSLPLDKRDSKLSRKHLEPKIKKDHHRSRREHERIHSTMIRYLQQMEEERHQRLLLWPTRLICPETAEMGCFKPLEFPNISGFTRPEATSTQHLDPNVEILRDRLLDIRQWLKDQYLVYREHCEVAASINKTYSPTTLEDATKVISRLKQKSAFKKIN